jgi:hypothetical protein
MVAIALTLNQSIAASASADVVAVVAATSPVTSLSKNAVADIFLCKAIRFPDGRRAMPIDQEEGSPERDEFYARFAGKSPAQLKAHWSKVIFTGRGKPPLAVANGVEARKKVAENPAAIAYIDRSLLDSSVKVLRID